MEYLVKSLKDSFFLAFKKHPFSECRLFLSASDMQSQALTRHAVAKTPEDAWNKAVEALTLALNHHSMKPVILRADWVNASESLTWQDWITRLSATRLGFHRLGLALDPQFRLAFTEQELNANAVLFQESDNLPRDDSFAKASFNKDRADSLCKRRFGIAWPDISPYARVENFSTLAVFVEQGKDPCFSSDIGVNAGLRDIDDTHMRETVFDLIQEASKTLVRLTKSNGEFIYITMPCVHDDNTYYNTLRHLGAVYAMLECYALLGGNELKDAIIRATDYVVEKFCIKRTLSDGTIASYFKECFKDEVRLGGNGIGLLLFTMYTKFIDANKYATLMQELVNGIYTMQQGNGGFVHILNSKTFALKQRFSIVYYDGEAVFGLLRFYQLTKNEDALDAVVRAFEYFIMTEHWKNFDHWLSYAADELTAILPERRYYLFGVNNVRDRLHRYLALDLTAPTRLEQVMAAYRLSQRFGDDLLPPRILYNAIMQRVRIQFTGYFWPETAMFFTNPKRLLGSFYTRQNAFRIRIDDIQHTISGLIAFYKSNITKNIASKQLEIQENAYFSGNMAEIFILLKHIIERPASIEIAVMRRIRLLNTYCNCYPKILTWEYQPFATVLYNRHVKNGKFVKADFLNMYDFFQNIDRKKSNCFTEQHFQKNSSLIDKNKSIKYVVVTDPDTKRPRYANHIIDGKIIRRDRFDPLGFLSMTELLDPETQKQCHRVYFRPDGTPALLEFYTKKDDSVVLSAMHLLDVNGNTSHVFTRIRDAIDYWLQELTSQQEKKVIALVDRRDEYWSVFQSAGSREKYPNMRLVQMIHSTHLDQKDHFLGASTSMTTPTKMAYSYLDSLTMHADAVVVMTERQRCDIAKRYGIDNTTVIPIASPPYTLGNAEIPVQPHKVVMAARFVPEKGHSMALDAWKTVLRFVPDAKLHLCGFGPLEMSLKNRVKREGMEHSVIFEGWREDMPAFFASSALSLIASTFEGFPLIILESMVVGCPVVSVDCNYGPSEQIIDGVNGYIVPLGDAQALGDRIAKILLDSQLRLQLSEGCKKSVEKFSQEKIAKKWGDLFVALTKLQ